MDQNIDLPEVLRLHELYAAGDPAGERADLSGLNLASAFLRGADLRGAKMRGVNLFNADLRDADLRGANLRGANLWGSDLRGAKLEGSNLNGANVCEAILREAVGLPVAADAPERLRAVAVVVLADPDSLQMGSWHSECGTAHCLAGWAIQQAGPLGRVLEQLHGSEMTGRLLLGQEAANHFYDRSEDVLAWLKTIID